MRRREKKRRKREPAPDPAPGELEIVQSFVNTLDGGERRDELATARSASRWLSGRSLLPSGTTLTDEERERAIAVREALRALLHENAGGKLRQDAVERLDEAIADARFQLRFNRDGSARFEPASTGLDDALGRILEIVVTSRHAGEWTRLKACGVASCRRAFWDASKSRTTKWCTARCGDRVRSERYRGTDKFRQRQKKRG